MIGRARRQHSAALLGDVDWASLSAPHLRRGLVLYVEQGVMPGQFLSAVLCNDLTKAVASADAVCRARLVDVVEWVWRNLPGNCWGSHNKVLEWSSAREAELAGEVEVAILNEEEEA